jgi:hypothetical protein
MHDRHADSSPHADLFPSWRPDLDRLPAQSDASASKPSGTTRRNAGAPAPLPRDGPCDTLLQRLGNDLELAQDSHVSMNRLSPAGNDSWG